MSIPISKNNFSKTARESQVNVNGNTKIIIKITGSVPERTLAAISPPCSCAPLHLFPRISLSFLFFSSFLNLLSFLLFLFLSENQNASLFLCRIFSFHMYVARLIFFSSKNIFLTFFECTCLCES